MNTDQLKHGAFYYYRGGVIQCFFELPVIKFYGENGQQIQLQYGYPLTPGPKDRPTEDDFLTMSAIAMLAGKIQPMLDTKIESIISSSGWVLNNPQKPIKT